MAVTLAAGCKDWGDFLWALANSPTWSQSVVARNFLLEENAGSSRCESYAGSGCLTDHGTYNKWVGAHERYLDDGVFRTHSGTLPSTLDPGNDLVCPETFRAANYQPWDLNLDLIRVESLRGLAAVTGHPEAQIKGAAQLALTSEGAERDEGHHQLDEILGGWAKNAQVRPTFAALYEDVADVFDSGDGWEDRLRDAMGLVDLDPGFRRRDVDILVFRYPVSAVPKLTGLGSTGRPLVAPAVLDGRFSQAFCPAPSGRACGYVIDLSGTVSELRREVVHPTVAYKATDAWKIGAVRNPVDLDVVSIARDLHLMEVRSMTNRPDYAVETDPEQD